MLYRAGAQPCLISSCSHCGVLNAIRTAIAVSGVDELHAVLGGFHLGVAPPDYIEHTVAELRAVAPDVLIPMHFTGPTFITKLRTEMPDQLIDWLGHTITCTPKVFSACACLQRAALRPSR